jgi:hypothetical protein
LGDLGQYAKNTGGLAGESPVVVIAPGTKMNIDGKVGGKVVQVSGDDQCPKDWMDNFHGTAPQSGCIVLNKPRVTAHFDRTSELWVVKKVGHRLSLVRPNGNLVAQAD